LCNLQNFCTYLYDDFSSNNSFVCQKKKYIVGYNKSLVLILTVSKLFAFIIGHTINVRDKNLISKCVHKKKNYIQFILQSTGK